MSRLHRLLTLFLCIAYSALQAQITLQLRGGLQARDESTGQAVMVLAQDEEVSLGVVCDDQARDIIIAGLDGGAFTAHRGGTSSSMTVINGKTSQSFTHNYSLTPHQIGSFTLGPATATVAGKSEESNTIAVRVLAGDEFDKLAGRSGQRSQLSCQLSTDASRAVVGQKVTMKVVMQDDGAVHDRQLQAPSFGKLRVTPVGQPTTEQTVINGAPRIQITQMYEVSADAPGTYQVGPAVAHFVVPGGDGGRDPFESFFSGGIGSFFGGGKKMSVRSNSLELRVDGLPATTRRVDGVGQFESVKLVAEKQLVDLNEPFTVTFTITGDGNFDAMLVPTLQLPDQFSVYDSATSFTPEPGSTSRGTKAFEYVVQISESGVHELCPQEFCYFDTTTQQYHTLLTAPVTVQVKAAKLATTALPSISQADDEPPLTEQEAVLEQEVEHEVPMLPWWWLLIVVLLPLFWWLRRRLLRLGFALTEKLGITSQERREKVALARLVAVGDVEALHTFFVNLLAQQWGCQTQEIDGMLVEERSAQWGWETKKSQSFAAYIDECSQAAFAPQMLTTNRKQHLLEKATYWHELVRAAIAQEAA